MFISSDYNSKLHPWTLGIFSDSYEIELQNVFKPDLVWIERV